MADHEEDRRSSDSAVGAGDIARLVPAAILLVILVLFVVANTQKVEVDFLFADTEAPLIVVLLATAVVGAVLVGLVKFRRRHS
ncbi:MAG: lipopolysaccharide assembly protein LapA domain-containing protein [Acidimicrobiales bacterium]